MVMVMNLEQLADICGRRSCLSLLQVPLAPPEDILSWLTRIGLLEVEDAVAEEDDGFGQADSLLEDEFDLDDDAAPSAESAL